MKDHGYGKLALIALTLMIFVVGCEPLEPVAPTLISPEDGAEIDLGTFALTWGSSPSVNHYCVMLEIMVGSVSDTVVDLCFDTTTSYVITLWPTTVNWKVATITDEDDSLWSETWSFTVGNIIN